jgi:hypothetical protein
MATVYVKVMNGKRKEVEADTVGDAAEEMGIGDDYTATVNKKPANFNADLEDDDMVLFSKAVKGGY